MDERLGVEVWITWDQDDDEVRFCEVAFSELASVDDKVYGLLIGNPDYLIEKVVGYLRVDIADEGDNVNYLLTVYGHKKPLTDH